ncbi:GNAT family N-acetyltransferase [Kineococcus sp. SYSU DK018]|uniref:GNAT family N-acetyltransferase n=1 Tax=Kineococcus sp. SYSU DK018 TaxID=3383139 RepID=UPI003D7EE130
MTHPTVRGAGLARSVAAAATEHALRAGLPPQWRARPVPSVRVAEAPRSRTLGQQSSLRLDV